MMSPELERRAAALTVARRQFVVATVVRAARPSSVRPGDSALVLSDGRIEGFVGGECAESSVRLHAARVLEAGEPLLLRVLPGDDDAPATEGAVTVHNPCLSGGALEIFLEPRLPTPRVVVVGDTPIARALLQLAEPLELDFVSWPGPELEPDSADLALVAASHGGDEEGALRWGIENDVPYVGLVASRRRGEAVLDALRAAGMPPERVCTPAGLDIGAREPGEIALSILAQIVAVRRGLGPCDTAIPAAAASTPTATTPTTAVDPICGMRVVAVDTSPHIDANGSRVWFCGEGCLRAYERERAGA